MWSAREPGRSPARFAGKLPGALAPPPQAQPGRHAGAIGRAGSNTGVANGTRSLPSARPTALAVTEQMRLLPPAPTRARTRSRRLQGSLTATTGPHGQRV